MTEENEKLKTEVKRLTEQCQALSQDNTALRECVVSAGGKIETEAPALPSGPTEEEKKMAAAAGAKAAAEAMEAAKKAAALAAGDSDEDTKSPEQGVKEEGGRRIQITKPPMPRPAFRYPCSGRSPSRTTLPRARRIDD